MRSAVSTRTTCACTWIDLPSAVNTMLTVSLSASASGPSIFAPLTEMFSIVNVTSLRLPAVTFAVIEVWTRGARLGCVVEGDVDFGGAMREAGPPAWGQDGTPGQRKERALT